MLVGKGKTVSNLVDRQLRVIRMILAALCVGPSGRLCEQLEQVSAGADDGGDARTTATSSAPATT